MHVFSSNVGRTHAHAPIAPYSTPTFAYFLLFFNFIRSDEIGSVKQVKTNQRTYL